MAYSTGIPPWEEMTTKQRKAAEWAWSHGELDVFILPHQQSLWALICAHIGLPTSFDLPEEYSDALTHTSTMKPLVIEVSRRFGKSSLVFLAMMALSIRNKRHTYYFVAPNEGDAEDILDDIYPNLIATCPPNLRPTKKKMAFYYSNGSRIKIGGTFAGAEGLRGRAANGSAVDEAGSIPFHSSTSCLTYVISSILLPQLSTTKGWQIILTTPPANMQHDYYKMAAAAEHDGRFIRIDINQNSSFTDEEIEALKEASYATDPSGGAWEREYLCHPKPDPKTLIIPEITQAILANNVVAYPKPNYFQYLHKYIALDHGTVDLNACLFGYYDFPNAKLIVEREANIIKSPTTKQIAHRILNIRDELWGKGAHVERAIADVISPQICLDLNAESGDIQFMMPMKTILVTDNAGREGMVNKLITGIGDGYIIIDPSCKLLLETIRTAQWKISNSGKREFARFDEIGHCDFLAALMYLWMGVYRNINPLQGKVVPDIQTQWVNKIPEQQGASHTLQRVINRNKPRNVFSNNPFKRN